MKKAFAFAIALALIVTAIIGGTAAQAPDATIETQVFSTEKVDIVFENTGPTGSVRIHPGATVQKEIRIKSESGSKSAWVWFTVTVPAVADQPLVTLSGTASGWEVLSTKVENNLCTYTLGYITALAAGETTTPGITELKFAGQIDYFDGAYYWVVKGQATPIQTVKNDFSIHFDAYAVEQIAGSTVEEAYQATIQTP